MAKRVAFMNNKGGVGKTLCTVALAEAAARQGWRVLVADMDPQGNATRRLGIRPKRSTLTTCLQPGVREGAAKDVVHQHGWSQRNLRIDVLPATLDLEDRSLEAGMPGAHYRLRQALFGVDADEAYDLTIIDCPPSIRGHLATMAVSALDGFEDTVLVPLMPEQDAMGGAMRVVDFVNLHRSVLGVPELEVTGLIVNGIRTRVSLHDARLDQMTDTVRGVPIVASVPQRARLAEIQDAGLPLVTDRDLLPILDEFTRLSIKLMGEKSE